LKVADFVLEIVPVLLSLNVAGESATAGVPEPTIGNSVESPTGSTSFVTVIFPSGNLQPFSKIESPYSVLFFPG